MHIIYIIFNASVATVGLEQLGTGESLGWNMLKASNEAKTVGGSNAVNKYSGGSKL